MNNLVLRATCFAQSFAAVAKDRRGVTAMEYGLIAALIAVVIIASITAVGTSLSAVFNAVSAKLIAAKPA
jgi:pilus assembly protein Flp/PilA